MAKKIHWSFQKLAQNRAQFLKKANSDLFQNSNSESNDELSNTLKFMKIKTRHSEKQTFDQDYGSKTNNEWVHTYQQSIRDNK